MSADDYYRAERLRRLVEYETALENGRAARARELDEALRAALADDSPLAEVLDPWHRDRFVAALEAVADLRRTW